MKPLVERRLQQLVSAGIIEPVTNSMDSSFCSSMLVIPKGKEDFRLVIDLRGPNQYIVRTPFPMPTLEKILAELNGAKWFSTIDLSNAFFHVELHENSRHLTNFFTEVGMFRCVRLPFGLCNAPDIFQEVLQRKILGDIKSVRNYLDDIIVYGETKDEHDANLAVVMDRLKEHGVKINPSKCVFGSSSVKFLGFTVAADGWKIEDDKLNAIKNFRQPSYCSEVKSFLGLVTFIDRFLMNRASRTKFLRALASSENFYWTENEEAEFRDLQNNAINSIRTLGYYSPKDKTELFVDASATGLGAILVQFNAQEIPRIIACASKALTASEQRYPQTHREALAVVWGVERFTFYLMSRFFTIGTDAAANEFIFGSGHHIGKRAVSRAEAWALRLQPYDFVVRRVTGTENVADSLSRIIKCSHNDEPFEEENSNHLLFTLDAGCMDLTLSEIETHAEQDEEIQQICEALDCDVWLPSLSKYECQKKSLHKLGSMVFKDDKIVLPKSLRKKALLSAHGGHVGEVSMKRIMREFFWWPRISKDAELFVKNCRTCTMLSRKNPPVPLCSRELPEKPWEILQIDFLCVPGFGSGEFLIVVDTYSRFLSVTEIRQTDAVSTNAILCDIFKLWGCPRIIQSDNGPPFQSASFSEFWEDKGVRVRKSIPFSPQSNGAVERQNQGIIKALAASKIDGVNWRMALQQVEISRNVSQPLDIRVGDSVLLYTNPKTKTDPMFSAERFTVVARHGAKVVVMSRNGIQYSRNVQDVKRAPFEEERETTVNLDSHDITEELHCEIDIGENQAPLPQILEQPIRDNDYNCIERTLRRREGIRKPARYDDEYVYGVLK
ncbi:uncharacterized protein K02A2.6-like [Wyeomyia smithii]|uniref:uncharacterized protein K02A2.6-like n=1 Tax=Wyeomyia smithii TaxID=174621 RepID=UPI002467FB72|nr:uncharacterized protein K02A2.6-like [Wyeomyia smithii]